ncbi:MAG: hypothetical protein LBU28_01980 [Spirochaetaceae bacterium]|jgi:hypothetical protein|nr:hypothetical protein [Spirochaetaceae bacterium]
MKNIRLKPEARSGLFLVLLFCPVIFLLGSCNQDPLFYDISNEVKPKEPVIPGTPTKIVEAGGKLYVSNRTDLFEFSQGSWNRIAGPPGRITDLASGESGPYCITEDSRLYSGSGSVWTPVDNQNLEGYTLQSIYGEGGSLFIGASREGDGYHHYAVFTGSGGAVISGSGEGFRLRGAVSGYFALGNGIYQASGGSPLPGSTGRDILAMIQLPDNTIAASTKDGHLLYGSGSSFTAVSTGYKFDRALAVYRGTGGALLLLVGIYTKGYMELDLGSGGSFPSGRASLKSPGEGVYGVNTTVHNYPRYNATLGQYALVSLYQSDAKALPLFASTVGKGLNAYQELNEGWQWNAY